jgi:hypothetical protein
VTTFALSLQEDRPDYAAALSRMIAANPISRFFVGSTNEATLITLLNQRIRR